MELQQRLVEHLQQIAKERDPYFASAHHFFVQQYIRQQMEQWGTVSTHQFQFRQQTHSNLVLDLPTSQKTPPVLIGAHYDAVPGSPGADDNASGVAVLLELGRILSGKQLNYPIRLVAFDLEEYDRAGSRAYVDSIQGQPLRLMLSLEMLGYTNSTPGSQSYPAKFLNYIYPKQGDFLALVGNLRTLPDLIRFQRQIKHSGTRCQFLPVPQNGKPIPPTRWSDHAWFWDKGYPAMMVTDTAWLRNPHYHKASDRLSTLDLDFLTSVCQSLAATVEKL